MEIVVVAAAVLVVIGLVGVVLPILPGLILVAAGIALWSISHGGAVGWTTLGIALAILVAGTVAKYLVPGRQLQESGVPTRSLVAGVLLGLVGFFVIPVIGLAIGFVGGVLLAEMVRLDGFEQAWPSTKKALIAVGWSILIELVAGLLATAVWIGAIVFY